MPPPPSHSIPLSLLSPLVSSRRLLLLLLLRHLRFRNAAVAPLTRRISIARKREFVRCIEIRAKIFSRPTGGCCSDVVAIVVVNARIFRTCVFSFALRLFLFSSFFLSSDYSQPGVRCNSKYSNSKDIGENMRVSVAAKNAGRRSAVDNSSSVTGGEKNRERNGATSARINDGADGLSQNSRPLPARLFFPSYHAPFSSLSLCRFVYIFVSLKISKNKLAPGIKSSDKPRTCVTTLLLFSRRAPGFFTFSGQCY